LSVAGDAEISEVIADFARLPKRAIFVVPSAYFIMHRDTIIAAAQHASIPAAYWDRLFTDAGGLLSYGIDDADVFRFAAGYVDRILSGEKPSDLPIQAPTKFNLSINLKTAQALGLKAPFEMLALADEVIQ
jgi:putative tryptophan/tyrosine transport system substrate-binding protein